MDTRIIAKVNKINIIVAEENTKESRKRFVPIQPLCDAMEVSFSEQLKQVKNDDILKSVIHKFTFQTKDKHTIEMECLPLKFIFGWIFTIDTKKNKLECYTALYEYFSEYAEYVEVRTMAIEKQLEKYQKLQEDFKDARFNLQDAKQKLNEAKSYSFDKYKENKDQFKLEFLENEE